MAVALFLFALGAAASLVGDHSHIVTGTTEYLSDAVPFVWSSPVWFPVVVAAATVSIAEVRLHLPNPRDYVTTGGVVAAVVGPRDGGGRGSAAGGPLLGEISLRQDGRIRGVTANRDSPEATSAAQ